MGLSHASSARAPCRDGRRAPGAGDACAHNKNSVMRPAPSPTALQAYNDFDERGMRKFRWNMNVGREPWGFSLNAEVWNGRISRRAWRKSPKNRYEIFIPHVRTSEPHEILCRFPSEEEVLIGRVTHEIRPNSSSR